jgi:hypothetical protein
MHRLSPPAALRRLAPATVMSLAGAFRHVGDRDRRTGTAGELVAGHI